MSHMMDKFWGLLSPTPSEASHSSGHSHETEGDQKHHIGRSNQLSQTLADYLSYQIVVHHVPNYLTKLQYS